MTDFVLHHLGPFDVPGLRPRRVRVYVPPREGAGPAPVLYMFDGQNVFDDVSSYAGGWHLQNTARALAMRHARAPVIVGVDHGGEARIEELSPWPSSRGGGKTDALLDWMVGTLGPRVREEFGLSAEPREVGVGGSSLGGLAALYAHFKRPEAFGLVMAMSPSLWVGRGQIFEMVASTPKPWTSRIYLDAGGLEAGGKMLAATERLSAELRGRGWDEGSLKLVAAKRGTHSEKHWRRRAPGAMSFLFAPGVKARARAKR
jgi:predicted alpha/beta superfamily hydrolase